MMVSYMKNGKIRFGADLLVNGLRLLLWLCWDEMLNKYPCGNVFMSLELSEE